MFCGQIWSVCCSSVLTSQRLFSVRTFEPDSGPWRGSTSGLTCWIFSRETCEIVLVEIQMRDELVFGSSALTRRAASTRLPPSRLPPSRLSPPTFCLCVCFQTGVCKVQWTCCRSLIVHFLPRYWLYFLSASHCLVACSTAAAQSWQEVRAWTAFTYSAAVLAPHQWVLWLSCEDWIHHSVLMS